MIVLQLPDMIARFRRRSEWTRRDFVAIQRLHHCWCSAAKGINAKCRCKQGPDGKAGAQAVAAHMGERRGEVSRRHTTAIAERGGLHSTCTLTFRIRTQACL